MLTRKLVWIVLISLFGNLLFAARASAQSNPPTRQDAAPSRMLLEKAQQQGSLRVILTVKTDFQPESMLAGPAAADAQREGIARGQQALLDKIAAYTLEEPYRFETVPLVVTTLTAEGLQAALDSGLVSAAQEDSLAAPTLAQSTALIGAPSAWASGYTGAGQTIAVLDTGVDKSHPFLTGKVVSEACYSTNDSRFGSSSVCPGGAPESVLAGSGIPCNLPEYCQHGTHVAGIVAGSGASFSGVAKGATLIAVQVFSRFDNSSNCGSSIPCALSWTSDQIKGLERVYQLRNSYQIAAVNMSLGGGKFDTNCDGDARKLIIDLLRAAGIATVVAAGNNGYSNMLNAPACISSAISVGSTGDGSSFIGIAPLDEVSDFSNSASFLTLLAPGKWINSSVPGGGYANNAGTSMAAPHVAGAWAVLRGKNPWASLDSIRNALVNTGLPVTVTRDFITVTKPRIRLALALTALPEPPVLSRKTFVPMVKK